MQLHSEGQIQISLVTYQDFFELSDPFFCFKLECLPI